MTDRDYQILAKRAVFREWERVRSTCLVMATGTGKTHVFSGIIDEFNRPTLVLAHRRELVYQARDRIQKQVSMECGVEMGWDRVDIHSFRIPPVIIGSVQSVEKRLDKYRPDAFDLIVCDEFHHGTAKTYRKIFDHFKQNSKLKILGVTATPDRADEEALSQVCDSVAFTYDIIDAVRDGWLVPVTQQFCPVSSLDFSHVRTTAGDLNQGDLAKIMEQEENIQGVIQPTLEVLYGLPPKTLQAVPVPEWKSYLASLGRSPRRGIVFTVSVAQAEACCNILRRVVDDLAEWICGKTPEDTRKEILQRFHSGKTPVVVNCNVLTEGFDAPATECIFMARPTKSRSLYTQMVGRATRPLAGTVDGLESAEARKTAIDASQKPRCRIIDFKGNSGRHNLICAIDMLSGKCSLEAIETVKRKLLEEGKPATVLRQLTNAEAEIERKRREEVEKRRLLEEARKKKVVAKANFHMVDVDAFGQQKFLVGGPSKEARRKSRISERQAFRLGQAGFNPRTLPVKTAYWILGILAKNNWQLPKESEWIRRKYGPKLQESTNN